MKRKRENKWRARGDLRPGGRDIKQNIIKMTIEMGEVKRERECVSHSRPMTDGWHLAPYYLRK